MVQVIFCYLYHCCFYRERIGKEIKIRRMVRRIVSLGSFVDITEQKRTIQNWKKQGMRL